MEYQNREISEFDLFVGGHSKTADFAIFFNIAFSNIKRMLEQLANTVDIMKVGNSTLAVLAEYIWKAHSDKRNSNGYILKDRDKTIIVSIIKKLEEVRNYHSHIWHSNEVLSFSPDLVAFVNEKYEKAMAYIYQKYPVDASEYEYNLKKDKYSKHQFFKKKGNEQFITVEGRIFFLSFFLTTGQMTRLLQQRRGSKRTDMPLFKMKHILYKYYCHRDGASIMGFHHEDDEMKQLNAEERKNILLARTAYKLITYLHDYPEYLADNETMPLMNVPKGTQEPLKVNTVRELMEFINAKNLFPDYTFSLITYHSKDAHSNQELERDRTVLLQSKLVSDFIFQVSFEDLYKLVMVSLKYDEQAVCNRLNENLEALCAQRRIIYTLLQKNIEEMSDKDIAFLLNRKNQFLRGSRKLTDLGVVLFEELGKKINSNTVWQGYGNARTKLTNYIRPANEHWERLPNSTRSSNIYSEHEPEPLIIYAHDFIIKTEQKFRKGNRFVYYVAKYLMDNNLVPDWYWEVEKFELKKKERINDNGLLETEESLVNVKEFQKQIGDGYRLAIENDHVIIGIARNAADTVARTGASRSDSFYQFSLGPRALRYLLAFQIRHSGQQNLNDFLAVAIKEDFEQLENNLWNNDIFFKLLENKFLPEYLRSNQKESDIKALFEKLKIRIGFITDSWEKAIQEKHLLKRAEKNRIVMDGYRLYDWTADESGNIKFLRANEYNYMSVCHYSLQHKDKKPGEKKSKFDHLYDELFQLNTRKPPIPRDIRQLLNGAKSLDDLLVSVIEDRKKYLCSTIDIIKDLPNKVKKQNIIALSRKLGLPIPKSLLSDESKETLQAKQEKTLKVLPFPIHPMLVLKHFAKWAYKSDHNDMTNIPQQQNNIFKNLRKPTFTEGLHKAHYDKAFIDKMLMTTESGVNINTEKQRHKWTGIVDNTQTEDAILWWIAKQYLANNPFTTKMAESLKENITSTKIVEAEKENGKSLTLGSLYGKEIVMELKQLKDTHNLDDELPRSIYMRIRMHQLDDVMFATDQVRLRRASLHYLRRHNEERDFWRGYNGDSTVGDDEGVINKAYTGTTTTTDDAIPYDVLRQELQLIATHAMYLAQYLLDWEMRIIHAIVKNKVKAKEKQDELMAYKSKENGVPHINFEGILELANITGSEKEDIKFYRNKSLHDGIPVNGSFAWWAQTGNEISALLGITEEIHIKKDNSKYLKS